MRSIVGSGNTVDSAVGGLVCDIRSTTLKNCSFAGTISQVQYCGGFVYSMDASSVIDGCSLDVTMTDVGVSPKAYPLAASTAAGAEIKNCSYKGSLNGAAFTAATVLTDGNATLTGNTLITE